MSPDQPHFTILLVEDEPADAELVRIAFREARLLVDLHHVADGVEALEFLRRAGAPRPDLILLDLNMPRMSGLEFLDAIKGDPMTAGIPVVVLTTSDFDQDVHRAYAKGASSYIVKPVDVEQFIAAMKMIEQYWVTIVTLPRKGP
ncbi:response regulator [Azospirillum halopraeferens]|uniref:response regulator n=1 Tax=Azospirillum halopraeferens TaxID=34010 RepID=UPI0003FB91DF|nr:response regulator [Azospirillum halopraeferens]